MHGVQVLAAVVAMTHTGLLMGVYFSSSIKTHVFVSTELNGLLFFRVCNTAFVLFELFSVAFYLYESLRGQWLYAALTSVLTAAVGWILLVCSPSDQGAHFAGAGVFIAGTVGYSVPLFLQVAGWQRIAFYFIGAGALVAAIIYVALYFAGLYHEAAASEWVAFITHAFLLFLFFSSNNPKSTAKGGERERLLKPGA